jgi:hypothetical protein
MQGTPPVRWQKGSVLDNFHAAAMVLGFDHLPVAYGLARVDWPDTDTRDAFLKALTNIGNGDPAAPDSTGGAL